uniref:Craniofacial development protein 2-like n=1 Tax=Haemonchus contortus TaxID=6289 RepID=A0A7I5E7Y3_HAECO
MEKVPRITDSHKEARLGFAKMNQGRDWVKETKTKETVIKKTNDGHLFVLGAKVDGKNVGGVVFLVHRRIEHLIDSTEVLSPRLAILRLRIDRRTTVSIINCYAPTSTATDGEKDVFYKELEEVTKNERSYYKYVVGDFNAVIHEESPRTGSHGIGETNENGDG